MVTNDNVLVDCRDWLYFPEVCSADGKYCHEGKNNPLGTTKTLYLSIPVNICYIRWSKWMVSINLMVLYNYHKVWKVENYFIKNNIIIITFLTPSASVTNFYSDTNFSQLLIFDLPNNWWDRLLCQCAQPPSFLVDLESNCEPVNIIQHTYGWEKKESTLLFLSLCC